MSREEFNGLRPAGEYIRSPEGGDDILSYESNRYIADIIIKGYYWVYAGYGILLVLISQVSRRIGALRLTSSKRSGLTLEHPIPIGWASRYLAVQKRRPSNGRVDHDQVLGIKKTYSSC